MNAENLEKLVKQAWRELERQVESGLDIPFDHEFTFQFHLAWHLARLLEFSDRLNVRFEVPCERDRNGKAIRLDLLVWVDSKEKVAIELKAPRRSEGKKNSAMTQFRMGFYKDIDRLWHLVESSRRGIRRGLFLAVVNENGYVFEGAKKKNVMYRTYHGVRLAPGEIIPSSGDDKRHPYDMRMPNHEIVWNWKCDSTAARMSPVPGSRNYWLEPIGIRAV